VLVAVALIALVGCSSTTKADNASPSVPSSSAPDLTTRTTTAPTGFDVPGAQWIAINRPDGRTQLAAMFVPDGPGPFPTVVYLHGVSGLGLTQLQWLPRLADAGYLVLAGCYLNAARPGFMPCDGLPPNDPSDATNIVNGYEALVRTAHTLGSARQGQIGLVGVSFGAGVALGADDPSVAAIVADSGYGTNPPKPVTLRNCSLDSPTTRRSLTTRLSPSSRRGGPRTSLSRVTTTRAPATSPRSPPPLPTTPSDARWHSWTST